MVDSTAFMRIPRHDRGYRPVRDRLHDWDEFVVPLDEEELRQQALRCMDCGVPFCHSGCPVSNLIPDWNALVTEEQWKTAIDRLHRTNNFPEFTGRICPAPCEAACTLNLVDAPVTIKSIECAIIDRAWEQGWVKPQLAERGTGHRIAVVGSGPAGMACAQQLARAGHAPTVFEKNERIGGLLRFGIPDFKLDRSLIDRRVRQMEAEGVLFRTGVNVGVDISVERLLDDYDVLVLAGGAEQPRDLPVPGRELKGIHYAMDFLTQQNRRNANLPVTAERIDAEGKHVIVIGGGDTGSDCIGTANRQGAASVTQLEILPEPPAKENKALSWPFWPVKYRTSSSQEEGCIREFSTATVKADGNGRIESLLCERGGEQFHLKADLVLLAMGFTGSPPDGVVARAGVELDKTPGAYQSSTPGIFACGDMRRGQSLVVWAIREGRDCAAAVDRWLTAKN